MLEFLWFILVNLMSGIFKDDQVLFWCFQHFEICLGDGCGCLDIVFTDEEINILIGPV